MKRALIGIIAIIIIVIVIIIILAGGSNNNNQATNTNTQPNQQASQQSNSSNQASETGQVKIVNMLFTPSQITVKKGATVTWTNDDSTTHTVVDDLSNVGGPHSGDIAPGSTYSFTFDKTGSFQYHCSIHPSMRGTIVVQ